MFLLEIRKDLDMKKFTIAMIAAAMFPQNGETGIGPVIHLEV